MRSPLSYLHLFALVLTAALFLILASSSCTKSNSNKTTANNDTASIIGTWTWAYQSSAIWDTPRMSQGAANPLTPANTGISRTLVFDTTGKFSLVHNDSIFVDTVNFLLDYLQIAKPVLLLPGQATETDTGFYQVGFGIVGCSITDTTTLLMQNAQYQAILTADTLLLHGNPCATRVVDIYVRQH